MGIKDLYKVLASECPDVLKTVKLDDFVGFRVAVDISIFLYKDVRTTGNEKWLNLFIQFLCMLKKRSIKAVCIFDGSEAPKEKRPEQLKRRNTVQKASDKMEEIISLVKIFKDDYLPTKRDTSKYKDVVRGFLHLKPHQDDINYKDPALVIDLLTIKIGKYKKQIMPITSVYADIAKEVIECLGLAWYQATGEAEALCSYMAINGQVDAVLTEDTDVLAYGTPCLMSKVDARKGTVCMIRLQELLQEIDMSFLQFRDMCIMLGCDYNERVKLVPEKKKNPKPVGMKTAIQLIRKYKSIDKMDKILYNKEVLKVERCRDIFTPPAEFELDHEPLNKPIDVERLEAFLFKNNCTVKMTTILEAWRPTDIVYMAPSKTKHKDEDFDGDDGEADSHDEEAEEDEDGDDDEEEDESRSEDNEDESDGGDD